MDDSASHPHDKPIDWKDSMLAMHDAVYRQGTLIGSRMGHKLHEALASTTSPEEASITNSHEQETAVLPINKRLMKPDQQQALVFEHWDNGKRPVTTVGSTKGVTYICDVEGCNKGYVRQADLRRHLESHKSGPRTHGCLANGCPRKGSKGFWRLDKFKDHMDRKHPEIELERWYSTYTGNGGYRDVEKREEHEALMRNKGYKPYKSGSIGFVKMSPSEMALD